MNNTDPADRLWTTTDYLLAMVVDLLQASNWQFASAHSKHRPRKPKPVPRPRDLAEKKRARAEAKPFWPGRTIKVKKGTPWQAETSASASPTSTSG